VRIKWDGKKPLSRERPREAEIFGLMSDMGYMIVGRGFVLTALGLALKKFLSRVGGISNFQAYKRSKPHFTEVFAFSKCSNGTWCYAWKSEFRPVFTEVATLVRLAKNGALKMTDF